MQQKIKQSTAQSINQLTALSVESTSMSTTATDKRILSETTVSNIVEPATKKQKTTTTNKKTKGGPKKLTQKSIREKMKYSTKAELTRLLKDIFKIHPHVLPKVFEHYTPSNDPIEPMQPVEPLLQECFHCGASCCKGDEETDLCQWFELKACSHCSWSVFDKTTLKEWFGFTNKEADKMKRTSSMTGMFRGIKYHYQAETIVKALKKKHGSLFTWLVHDKGVYDRHCTVGERLEQASKKAEKTKIINKAFQHSRDTDLEGLVHTAMRYEEALKLQDSVIGAFVPNKLPH